jgi:hypothetical protein
MSFLRKLFNREENTPPPAAAESVPEAPCPHVTLIPHWENHPDDMGNNDKADRFTCDACDAEFSREEGLRLFAKEKERVEQIVGEG